jgi:regulatory protein
VSGKPRAAHGDGGVTAATSEHGDGGVTAATPEHGERLERALALSFAYLNRRECSVHEVRAQLERKGISAETAEACLRRLQDDGYLDDQRYALMFVHDKRELQDWGSERIRRELDVRGVERHVIAEALAQHETEWAHGESELDRALGLLGRRFPAAPRDRRERDRALGMLIRKGFDSDLAVEALAAYAHPD